MFRIITVLLSLVSAFISTSFAQDQFAGIEIKTIKVSEGIYMLEGSGGNIGIATGEDGIFMIDDQYSPLTPKILAAISKISDKPIKFLINTHWHFDHTGGNENLGNMDVVILAHDNVYKRLSAGQLMKDFDKQVPASPKVALPVVSFNDQVTFHLNDLHIQARHFAHAHTDGDSILFFKNKNVIHTGDIFFNGFYPYIDSGSGGSIYGMIDATATLLKLVDDTTKIIPGHGPLANKQDLQTFHDMLVQVVDNVTPLTRQGLSLEEATKRDPLKKLNKKWGNGFLKPDMFLSIIYQTIADHK
ncbi:MAG: MBL fold metallo-hydrolase [Emcibacter sp.]|nr:MBL fold metallo-hydrolase [Emcibacter sp.]